jgi:hypothetical protein
VRLVLPTREALVSEVSHHFVDSRLTPPFVAVDLDQQTADALGPIPRRRDNAPLGPLDVHLDEISVASEDVGQLVERPGLDGPIS